MNPYEIQDEADTQQDDLIRFTEAAPNPPHQRSKKSCKLSYLNGIPQLVRRLRSR